MNLRSAILKYKVYHLLVWCMVALVWYYLRYQDYSTTDKAVKVTLIKTVDLAIMIFLANYVLIPQFLYRKKYVVFVSCFIGMILVSSVYKMYLIGKVTNNPALLNWAGNFKARIYDNVIPHFFL